MKRKHREHWNTFFYWVIVSLPVFYAGYCLGKAIGSGWTWKFW